MAGELWGFWLRRLVRDADLGVLRGDPGGLFAMRLGRFWPLILVGGGWSGRVVAVVVWQRIGGLGGGKATLADARGVRC
jgi:hypothetical protein